MERGHHRDACARRKIQQRYNEEHGHHPPGRSRKMSGRCWRSPARRRWEGRGRRRKRLSPAEKAGNDQAAHPRDAERRQDALNSSMPPTCGIRSRNSRKKSDRRKDHTVAKDKNRHQRCQRAQSEKTLTWRSPGTSWWSLPVCPVSGKKFPWPFDTIYAGRTAPVYGEPFLLCPDVSSARWKKPNVGLYRGTLSGHLHRPEDPPQRTPAPLSGTVTEIYDYLRLLYARIGIPALPHLRQGDRAAGRWTRWWTRCLRCRRGTRIQVLAPVVRQRKGEHAQGV